MDAPLPLGDVLLQACVTDNPGGPMAELNVNKQCFRPTIGIPIPVKRKLGSEKKKSTKKSPKVYLFFSFLRSSRGLCSYLQF